MDFLIHRYRNLTVLVLVIGAQLILLAYQVKTREDVPLIRGWAVTIVTPVARAMEFVRRNTIGFVEDYLVLVGVQEQNQKLREENGKLKVENQFLKTEVSAAKRYEALSAFQGRTRSRTVAARVIGTSTASNAAVMFVDRGSLSDVKRGMAVITPEGIVGRVIQAYPGAAQVLLVTDTTFGAGVMSAKNRVYGTLKGLGPGVGKCKVDYVQNGETVEVGEVFYTSGDDRVFPRGLPVGVARVVQPGRNFKEITLAPFGTQNGLEEVLIVLEGAHQELPQLEAVETEVTLLAPPPADPKATASAEAAKLAAQTTDADRMLERYRKIGEAQSHTYGSGNGRVANFNIPVDPKPAGATQGGSGSAPVPVAPKPVPARTAGASGAAAPLPRPATTATAPVRPQEEPVPSAVTPATGPRPTLRPEGEVPRPAARPAGAESRPAPAPERPAMVRPPATEATPVATRPGSAVRPAGAAPGGQPVLVNGNGAPRTTNPARPAPSGSTVARPSPDGAARPVNRETAPGTAAPVRVAPPAADRSSDPTPARQISAPKPAPDRPTAVRPAAATPPPAKPAPRVVNAEEPATRRPVNAGPPNE